MKKALCIRGAQFLEILFMQLFYAIQNTLDILPSDTIPCAPIKSLQFMQGIRFKIIGIEYEIAELNTDRTI